MARPVGTYVWTSIEERLAANLVDGPIPQHSPELGPCLIWTASCDKKGYGQLNWRGKVVKVHRVVWELAHGSEEKSVCHRCDNPTCARLAHLFAGTHQDNARDSVAKGRHSSQIYPGIRAGDNHWMRRHPERVPQGEARAQARLTAAQVAVIRERYACGEATQMALAAAYGVRQTTVSAIVRGETWRKSGCL